MSYKIGFEYRRGKMGKQTPFDIFLRYTNEKEKSATVLGKILTRLIRRHEITFLEIGSGNGEYLRLALDKVENSKRIAVTLLEPSVDLARQLRGTIKLFPRNTVVSIIRSSFGDFKTNERFDIILVSHVPLAKDNLAKLPAIYARMMNFLKPNGSLIMVLRDKDEIHQFRTMFKSQIMGRDYKSLTISDAELVFRKIARQIPLRLKKFSAKARTLLPYPENMRDVIAIVEFLLNTKWEEITTDIRGSIISYIRSRNNRFQQIDGFLVVKRVYHQKKR